MSAKFTPGPWKVGRANQHLVMVADGRSVGLEICRAKAFVSEYREQSLANARLIAAAPEMYEALKLAEITTNELCAGQHPENACWEILHAIRAALAKAEG